MQRFRSDFEYHDRRSKARHVWEKYRPILESATVLDVGSDECHLREHLPDAARYHGVGLGGSPDRRVDLERQRLPFADGAFETVLCLDVLEHIENPQQSFDELCRVASGHVVVSLPNPWRAFWRNLNRGRWRESGGLKFYGLPGEKPADRHKWFFSLSEAEAFVQRRAEANGWRVLQLDYEGQGRRRPGLRGRLRRWVLGRLLGGPLPWRDLEAGSLWAVLEPVR